MNILKMMGLMRVSEHEECAESISSLKRQLKDADTVNGAQRMRILTLVNGAASFRADALAWREKKRKDADYEANRRVRKK